MLLRYNYCIILRMFSWSAMTFSLTWLTMSSWQAILILSEVRGISMAQSCPTPWSLL